MNPHTPGTVQLWAGRVVSALPVIALIMSAVMKLTRNPEMVGTFTGKYGYPEASLTVIAIVEIVCTVLYAVPKTSVLGAVLLTGYLGGAIATHVRVSEPFVAPLVLGVLVWVGLYLRDLRLRALLPLRS